MKLKNEIEVKRFACFCCIFAMFTSSFSGTIVRYTILNGTHAVTAAFWRFFIAAMLQFLIVLCRPGSRKELFRLDTRQAVGVFIAGTCLGLHFSIWFLSLQYIPVMTSTFLSSTQPLFVAILAYPFLHEKPASKSVYGIIAAITGIFLVAAPKAAQPGAFSLAGNLLALFSAMIAPGYTLLGRALRGEISLPVYGACVYLSACVAIVAVGLIAGVNVFRIDCTGFFMGALLAIVCQMLGHNAYNWALKYVKAVIVSSVLLIDTVFASIWAYMFFKEAPTVMAVYGCFIILSGILYFLYFENKDAVG